MSSNKGKVIGFRVDAELYERIKKSADGGGLSVSEYVFTLMEPSFDENNILDVLLWMLKVEIYSLMDMFSLMQGFNSEVYATLLARTSKNLDADGKREMQLQRDKAIEGLNNYKSKGSKRLLKGESIWESFAEKTQG